jgi:hypothetical protein
MPVLAVLLWGVGAFVLRLPFSAQVVAGCLSIASIVRGARRQVLNSAFARSVPPGSITRHPAYRAAGRHAATSRDVAGSAWRAAASSGSGGPFPRLGTSGNRMVQTPLAGRSKPIQW